ncbi:MAG: sigma-54 dependent transcriptional regulator [Deltaproteobacteria bacterium]|jgi:DNA-binding NtrC family response regulator|nr:sigma-54 dependent transcriptional regulator [Deltaproteobacteria bacterium]
MKKVLVAVKNNKLAQTIIGACLDRGEETDRLSSMDEAKTALAEREDEYSVLVLNLDDLSTSSEKKILAAVQNLPDSVRILGLGSGFDLKMVTDLFRAGLYDYLNLPPDPLELAKVMNNILEPIEEYEKKPAAPKAQTQVQARVSSSGHSIIGQSSELRKVFRLIEKVAVSDATVMIQGESGTGKELIARAIHQSSPRRDKPLIPVNCGAIPEELLEAEFFGHEKGAFTGAIRERIGRFEMADGGTIFLDEIGDMSSRLQVKLLRVLQEREFERVGGQKTIEVDIRVITATNIDLSKAVAEGRFREDLFYRLNVIPLLIPPLRERSEDIPLLIDFFLQRLRQSRDSQVTGIDPETLKILMDYHWPGNIRELENLLERMVILADNPVLTAEDLPPRLLERARAVKPLPKLAAFLEPAAEVLKEAEPEYQSNFGPSQSLPESAPEPRSADDSFSDILMKNLDQELQDLIKPLVLFPEDPIDLPELVAAYETALIKTSLKLSGGVKNEAARRLSVNRTTLVEKLKKYSPQELE